MIDNPLFVSRTPAHPGTASHIHKEWCYDEDLALAHTARTVLQSLPLPALTRIRTFSIQLFHSISSSFPSHLTYISDIVVLTTKFPCRATDRLTRTPRVIGILCLHLSLAFIHAGLCATDVPYCTCNSFIYPSLFHSIGLSNVTGLTLNPITLDTLQLVHSIQPRFYSC